MSTVTDDIKGVLLSIRQGQADAATAAVVESIAAKDVIRELKGEFPLVFQARDVGRKFEIGLARGVEYTLDFRTMRDAPFQSVRLLPRLNHCVLVSGTGDAVSEITYCRTLAIRPTCAAGGGVKLRFGKGFKFDKTVDGWALKELRRRWTLLSEAVLQKHGWQFNVLPPFGRTDNQPQP